MAKRKAEIYQKTTCPICGKTYTAMEQEIKIGMCCRCQLIRSDARTLIRSINNHPQFSKIEINIDVVVNLIEKFNIFQDVKKDK
ncbi:MAG: hypothetical protein WDA06_00895 [Phenylobacterium sp.]